jgi:predicted nucleotidyltransferase
MENRFGLEERWHQAFGEIFRKYPSIERVTIFGSRAKGNYKPFSDIDLCLYGKQVTELDAQHLKEELEELYHPYFVDVLAFEALSDPVLRQTIKRDEQMFFEGKIKGFLH